jgi:hypothetical protein
MDHMPAPSRGLRMHSHCCEPALMGCPERSVATSELEAQAIHLGIPPPRNARRCGSEQTGRGCSPSPVASLIGGTPRISWIQTHTVTAGTLSPTKRGLLGGTPAGFERPASSSSWRLRTTMRPTDDSASHRCGWLDSCFPLQNGNGRAFDTLSAKERGGSWTTYLVPSTAPCLPGTARPGGA